jgi:hypothetical protein
VLPFLCFASHWTDIARAIGEKAPTIAKELWPRVQRRLASYAKCEAEGRLKLVILMPTGPGPGHRSNDIPINLSKEMELRIAATGGRLFGFGVRTSEKSYDPLIQMDYWHDFKLQVHYHLIDDVERHPPGHIIWP